RRPIESGQKRRHQAGCDLINGMGVTPDAAAPPRDTVSEVVVDGRVITAPAGRPPVAAWRSSPSPAPSTRPVRRATAARPLPPVGGSRRGAAAGRFPSGGGGRGEKPGAGVWGPPSPTPPRPSAASPLYFSRFSLPAATRFGFGACVVVIGLLPPCSLSAFSQR